MRDLPTRDDGVKKPPHPVYPDGNANLSDEMIRFLNWQQEQREREEAEKKTGNVIHIVPR
jgi:hypothetical protein